MRSLTGFDSEFSFSKTCYRSKAKETRLPYNLIITGWRVIGVNAVLRNCTNPVDGALFCRPCSNGTDLVVCVMSLDTVVRRGYLECVPGGSSICVTQPRLTYSSGFRRLSPKL